MQKCACYVVQFGRNALERRGIRISRTSHAYNTAYGSSFPSDRRTAIYGSEVTYIPHPLSSPPALFASAAPSKRSRIMDLLARFVREFEGFVITATCAKIYGWKSPERRKLEFSNDGENREDKKYRSLP